MNSRRLMGFPSGRGPHPSTSLKKEPSCASQQIWVANGRDGVKTRIPPERSHVSFRRRQTLGQAARDFNARGRYCPGAGVEKATSFPFDTASIGRTLSQQLVLPHHGSEKFR